MFGFDPRNPRVGGKPATRGAAPWLDAWRQATDWWVDPAGAGAQDMTAVNDRVLSELVDGIVGRFEGERVGFTLRGRPVGAVLDWIRVRRAEGRYEARLELTGVQLDDWGLISLSVVLDSIRIDVAPSAQLTVSGIELAGRASVRSCLPLLDRLVPGWRLDSDQDGRVTASRGPGRPVLIIEPAIRDGRLEVELRAIRWRARRLELPRWLRITRGFALPALAGRVVVLDGRRQGGDLEFRATISSWTERLDLARLREAIAGRRPGGAPSRGAGADRSS